LFFAVVLTVIGYYALPVCLAKADANLAVSGADSGNVTVLRLRVTAYASTVGETDNTPFITANGTRVRDGIVATNLLPFGTKIKIPAFFGDKVFTVEDRMNARVKKGMDIWMPSREQALHFGANYADVMVLSANPSFGTKPAVSLIAATVR
jgi:3D (Asp-Asp-Asp) domain-containing protein